jgi:hypothetical protein
VTTIAPEELYFGAPAALTYGGTDVGGTVDPPKIIITPTVYTPEFQNAGGPIKGTDMVTKIHAAAQFTVNQITATKMGWGMPGSTTAGDFTTWSTGRIPSTAYHDVVLTGVGLDGRHMIVTIFDAIQVGPVEFEYSNGAIVGMKMNLEGRYTATTPTVAPFQVDLAAAGSAT